MLDLKAKLAAAGLVSAEQVKAFDDKEAKAKEAKRARAKRKNDGSSSGRRPGGKPGEKPKSKKKSDSRQRKPSKTATDSATLKTLNKGEAYARIRKIVEHSRLDDKEQTIPGVDDTTFNFVTAQGSIGKLYVTEETAKKLRDGNAAIFSFMSHHGLSHCVLPKDIAIDLAQVFPYWLRHLRGNDAAGQLEPPPEPKKRAEATESDGSPSEENASSAGTPDETPPKSSS